MRLHPTHCVCKSHLEMNPPRPIRIPPEPGRSNKKAEQGKVSSLRNQFELGTTQKVDPRTGLPPPRPNNTSGKYQPEKKNKQSISVITSQ